MMSSSHLRLFPTGTPYLKFTRDILVILTGNEYILIIYHAELLFLLV
jgi:hypothetical protein